MSGQSQFQQDSMLAEHYFYLADSTWYNPDTCLMYSMLAEPFLKRTKLWEKYIRAINGKSYCYKQLLQPEKYRNNLFYTLTEAEKYLSADNVVYQYAKSNMASYQLEVLGNYKKAVDTYLELQQFIAPNNKQAQATINNNIGKAYQEQGDYESAIAYLQNSLNLRPRNPNTQISIYKTTSTLGICYQNNGQLDKALEYFYKAEQIILPFKKKYPQYIAGINFFIAEANYELGQYEEALKRLEIAEKQPNKTDWRQGNIYKLRGKIWLEKNKLQPAQQEFQQALKAYPKENFLNKAKAWNGIAAVHHKSKKYEQALDAAQQGIGLLTDNFELADNPAALPNRADAIRSEIDLLPIVLQKAAIFYDYYQSDKNIKWLKTALETYEYAFHVRAVFQQQLFDERSKLFQNKAQSFQHKAIALAWELYQKTNQQEYAEKAFAFAEMSKAGVLLEEIKKKEAAGYSNVNDTLISQRYDLKGELNYLQKKAAVADTTKAALNARILAVQRQLQEIEQQLNEKYPEYYKLVKATKTITPAEIQEKLSANTALIEYFLHDNQLYTFRIQKDGFLFKKQELDYNLREKISNLLAIRKLQTLEELNTYQALGYELYQLLIASQDVSDEVSKLIIVPDKALSFLPFELLLTDKTTGNMLKTFPFLLKRYTTSYTYSATILQKQGKEKPAPKSLLAVAPVFDDSPQHTPLKYSEESVHNITAVFKGKKLLRQNASLKNYKALSEDYQMLHLSTHATGGDSLMPPAIFFHQDTLLLNDIYAMRLHAQLVVLSACQTALGKYEEGEGIMSLSRGFTYAGVPALVTSLWSVNDKSTTDIMQYFYQHLRAGLPGDEALQNARLDYIKKAKNIQASPYYWGAFIYIGEAKPVQCSPSSFPFVYLVIPSLLLGLLILFFYWKRKQKINSR